MSKPDMQALKDGSVTSQNNLRLGEQCDDQYLGSNCQYSIVAVYTCINIPFVLLQRGAAESALHCRSLAWPAPNKDRWPVLKTDGWVFGLQQIGLRRPLNQGMALQCSDQQAASSCRLIKQTGSHLLLATDTHTPAFWFVLSWQHR